MKKLIYLITILLVILAGIISFLTVNIVQASTIQNTINIPVEDYTYTKAICTDTYCQDYVIACKGQNLVSKTPIQGALIGIPNNWEDPRSEKIIYSDCN